MSNSPPSVSGYVGVKIRTTQYDQRWRRALESPLTIPIQSGLATAGLSAVVSLPERVNTVVNRMIRYELDVKDSWQTADETMIRQAGDCEDLAILKMQTLISEGFPVEDIWMLLVRDLALRQDHALLVVEQIDGPRALDVGTNLPLKTVDLRDYVPIVGLSATPREDGGYAWIYGRKKT